MPSLTDVKAKSEKWSKSFNGKLDEVFVIQDEITAAAARVVVKGLGKDAPGARVMDPQAWLLFIEGRYQHRLRDPDRLSEAESAFKRVLDIEPEFAPAMLELARIYMDPGHGGCAGQGRIRKGPGNDPWCAPGLTRSWPGHTSSSAASGEQSTGTGRDQMRPRKRH